MLQRPILTELSIKEETTLPQLSVNVISVTLKNGKCEQSKVKVSPLLTFTRIERFATMVGGVKSTCVMV